VRGEMALGAATTSAVIMADFARRAPARETSAIPFYNLVGGRRPMRHGAIHAM